MRLDEVQRISREIGAKPWVVWLIVYKLKIVLFLLWLFAIPLFLLAYCKDAYKDWRDALRFLNDAQVRIRKARKTK